MTTIIFGDIGGTNSRFNLVVLAEGVYTTIKIESIPSKSHKSFRSILHEFLHGKPTPQYGVFAVAGVAKGTTARFVNMGWGDAEENSVEMEAEFHIEKIVFLNDFEAAGYGCLELDSSQYIQINPEVSKVPDNRIVVMGPGTGLGEAILTCTNGVYSAWPGEGGHSDFAAHDDEQWKFSKFMMNLLQNNEEYQHFRPCEGVSQEVCIAGVGAFHIYEFYRMEFPELVDTEFDEIWNTQQPGEKDNRMKMMMQSGFNGSNQLCIKSVQLWLKLLAYECGNLISKSLPFAGLYLIGGLITKNFDGIIANIEAFKAALLTKPVHICEVIKNVPFFIVRNEEVGMFGTVWYSKNVLKIT